MKKTIFILSAIFLLTGNFASAKIVVCLNFGSGWHCNVLEGNCNLAGGEGLSDMEGYPNGRYCKQLRLVPKKLPVIRLLENGRAFVINNGQITQIGSDKFKRFFEKVDKMTKEDFQKFLKNDDGIVSQKRLEIIAKELGAKIEKGGKSIKANYCPACDEKKSPSKKEEKEKQLPNNMQMKKTESDSDGN